VHFAIAFVALARGERAGALRAADAALALRPRYPEARLVRADALSQLGREDQMRRELARFLAEAPPAMAAERARAERRLRARTTGLEIQ
jgi:regulator of sirC expression with transglutaminase-like and TPR domain